MIKRVNFSNESLLWISHMIVGIFPLIIHIKPLPVIIQMCLQTAAIIYIGSHLSLYQLSMNNNNLGLFNTTENIKMRDAYLFPVIGSFVLSTLYIAFKYLSTYWVNMVIMSYITVFSCITAGELITPIIDSALLKNYGKTKCFEVLVHQPQCLSKLSKNLIDPIKVEVTISKIIGHSIGILITLAWVFTGHWIFHNVVATIFCLQAIRMISVYNFKIAFVLLIGLFGYDIFWVFGTNVMASVAKLFQAPAKLIFPITKNPFKHSILGLGDIVVPGIFIAMTLRFDHKLSELPNYGTFDKMPLKTDIVKFEFKKMYFWCSMVAYQIGLIIASMTARIYNHPQPALLYLVPANILGFILPVILKKDLPHLWAYTEDFDDANKIVDKNTETIHNESTISEKKDK